MTHLVLCLQSFLLDIHIFIFFFLFLPSLALTLFAVCLSVCLCCSTIRPLDRDAIIASVKKCKRVVAVEEGWPQCGICSEIAAIVMESEAFDYLDAPMERVTGADVPMPYSLPLEKASVPQFEDLMAAVKRTVARKL